MPKRDVSFLWSVVVGSLLACVAVGGAVAAAPYDPDRLRRFAAFVVCVVLFVALTCLRVTRAGTRDRRF